MDSKEIIAQAERDVETARRNLRKASAYAIAAVVFSSIALVAVILLQHH